jgi:hypothetical protein
MRIFVTFFGVSRQVLEQNLNLGHDSFPASSSPYAVISMLKNLSMFILWDLTPCGLVDKFQLFGETYCLHLQG